MNPTAVLRDGCERRRQDPPKPYRLSAAIRKQKQRDRASTEQCDRPCWAGRSAGLRLTSWPVRCVRSMEITMRRASIAAVLLAIGILPIAQSARAHEWYPLECCHAMDCAEVETSARTHP